MDALGEACKKVCKCNAFPRYRMLFFSAEQRRRRRQGTLSAECTPQVNLFIDLVRELVNFNLFEEAARQLKQGASLESVLCDVLLVNTKWHRMLIGRDVVMLCRGDMPDLAARAGFTLEDNDFVGGGARKFLYSIELGRAASSFAVSSASSDGERLRLVHAALLPLLKWRRWIAPLGWTLSHTEELLCEFRKWMLRATPRRHRVSGRVRRQVDRNRILPSDAQMAGIELIPKQGENAADMAEYVQFVQKMMEDELRSRCPPGRKLAFPETKKAAQKHTPGMTSANPTFAGKSLILCVWLCKSARRTSCIFLC